MSGLENIGKFNRRILIVEDDNDINSMLNTVLTQAGYECISAYSGTEGRLHVAQGNFDLILLDLMLPGLTGVELLQEIRNSKATPVIIISAKDTVDDKVDLLKTGANDYITKPFDLKELLARVEVQLRKNDSTDSHSNILQYKGLVLEQNLYIAILEGVEISLTKQEFKILKLFLSYPNKIFSKQEIYDYAWDGIYIGEDKTINVHISNIRQKFKKVTDEEYIETVWGIGFRLTR